MKTKLLLPLIALLFFSCSKDGDNDDLVGKTLRATYTFSPGASNASIAYENKGSGYEGHRNNVNALLNINDEVRLGDNIRLFMDGAKQPVGNFAIRLSINGKEVSEVNGGAGNMNIQLFYTVTEKDFR